MELPYIFIVLMVSICVKTLPSASYIPDFESTRNAGIEG